MKKIISIALVLMMVVALSVSAMAAGSVTSNVEVVAKNEAGATVEVVVTELADVEASVAVEAAAVKVAGDGAKVVKTMDITGTATAENPLLITFTAPAGAKVLHWENGEWVNVTSSSTDTTVTGKFTSLSPVAIVAPAANNGGANNGGAGNGTTAPQTGDTALVFLAGAVILGAGVATAGALRKKIEK